jgi:hypothetical protein
MIFGGLQGQGRCVRGAFQLLSPVFRKRTPDTSGEFEVPCLLAVWRSVAGHFNFRITPPYMGACVCVCACVCLCGYGHVELGVRHEARCQPKSRSRGEGRYTKNNNTTAAHTRAYGGMTQTTVHPRLLVGGYAASRRKNKYQATATEQLQCHRGQLVNVTGNLPCCCLLLTLSCRNKRNTSQRLYFH